MANGDVVTAEVWKVSSALAADESRLLVFIATVEMVIIKNDIPVFCQVPLPQQVAKVLERKFKALATSLSDRWAIYFFFFSLPFFPTRENETSSAHSPTKLAHFCSYGRLFLFLSLKGISFPCHCFKDTHGGGLPDSLGL